MLSVSETDDQKSIVYCIPVPILIKLQISIYILLENLKLHCHLLKLA